MLIPILNMQMGEIASARRTREGRVRESDMGFLGFRAGEELQRRAQHEQGEEVRMDGVRFFCYPCGCGCAESNHTYSRFVAGISIPGKRCQSALTSWSGRRFCLLPSRDWRRMWDNRDRELYHSSCITLEDGSSN